MKRWGVAAGLLLCMVAAMAGPTWAADKITVWPFLRYDPTGGKTDLEILWPLYDMEKSSEKNMWRLFLTAYSRKTGNGETTWDLLWPAFRIQYDQAGNRSSRFFPLFFGHDPRSRYLVLFPELWIFGANTGAHTIVVLPWFRNWNTDSSYINALTPFFWGRDNDRRYGLLLPIFYLSYRPGKPNWALFLFPFFHNTESPTKSVTGFLPWWVKRDGDKQFANLFPVLWNKKGGKFDSFAVLPLFYKVGDSRVLFPVYWDVGDFLLAIPFYGKGKFGEARWQTIAPPLYVHWTKGDYAEHDLLFPLVQWGTNGKDRQIYAFRPIFDYVRKGEYVQRSFLLRLGAFGRGPDRRLDRLFPLFNSDRQKDGRDLEVLWPLYGEAQEGKASDRRVVSLFLPGLGTMVKPFDSWSVLNLAWWGKSQVTEKKEGVIRTNGLWPLYSLENRIRKEWRYVPEQKKSEETLRAETSFRLVDLLTPLDKILLDVPGLFSLQSAVNMSEFPILNWFVPLFERVRSETGAMRYHVPFHLFHWEKFVELEPVKQAVPASPAAGSQTGGRMLNRYQLALGTPFVFWNSWGANWHNLHLLSLFWDITNQPYSNTLHSQGLWPFYTYKRHPRGGLNFSFLDPLWFWGQATGEEEHVSGLLKIVDFRRQTNGDSRFMVLWRAYRRDVRGDTTSWEAFPFMGWEKSPAQTKFSFLWRLYAYEKVDGKRAMRVFFSPKIGLGSGGK